MGRGAPPTVAKFKEHFELCFYAAESRDEPPTVTRTSTSKTPYHDMYH